MNGLEIDTPLKHITPERIKKLLEGRERESLHHPECKRAAVLLCLFEKGDSHILLTRRTNKVRHHKGQISLPGGAFQQGDPSLLETALRETEEEIGLKKDHVHILGQLSDISTVTSGYIITPYVGIFTYPYPFAINQDEIAYLFDVPIRALVQEGVFREKTFSIKGGSFPTYFYRYEEHVIWGATAKILRQFLCLLSEGL